MLRHHRHSSRHQRALTAVLAVAFLLGGAGALAGHDGVPTPQSSPKLESTIFKFDGKDFVRTSTTLMTEKGSSATNTKLEHDTPAFKALMQKHSYSGDATVFGKRYDANYAPLIGSDGKLTGALFVAVAK